MTILSSSNVESVSRECRKFTVDTQTSNKIEAPDPDHKKAEVKSVDVDGNGLMGAGGLPVLQ